MPNVQHHSRFLLSFGGTKLRRSPTPAQLWSLPAGREHVANTCEDWPILSQTAIVELTGLVAYFMLANFSNRLHLLILIASLLVYGTIAMAILALGSHVSVCTQRVLRAIDIVNTNGPEKDE